MDSSGGVSRDHASVYDSGSPDYGFASGNVTFGTSATAAGEGSYRSTTVGEAGGTIGYRAAERAFVANLPEPDLAGFWMNVVTMGSLALGGGEVVGLVQGAWAYQTSRAGALSFGALRTTLRSSQTAWKGSTRLGLALSTYAGRNPQLWGKISGAQKTWNAQGLSHLREIICGPGSFKKVTTDGLSFIEKRLPDVVVSG